MSFSVGGRGLVTTYGTRGSRWRLEVLGTLEKLEVPGTLLLLNADYGLLGLTLRG